MGADEVAGEEIHEGHSRGEMGSHMKLAKIGEVAQDQRRRTLVVAFCLDGHVGLTPAPEPVYCPCCNAAIMGPCGHLGRAHGSATPARNAEKGPALSFRRPATREPKEVPK